MIESTNENVFTDSLVCKLIAHEAFYVLRRISGECGGCRLLPQDARVLSKLQEFLKDAAEGRRAVKSMTLVSNEKAVGRFGMAVKAIEWLVCEGKIAAQADFLVELERVSCLLIDNCEKVKPHDIKVLAEFCGALERFSE